MTCWLHVVLLLPAGDNIFVNLKARRSLDQAPNVLNHYDKVPRHHMPGMHWYHPHRTGR
jgi:hypothetical protein